MKRWICCRALLLSAILLPLVGCAAAGPPRVAASVTVRSPGAYVTVLPAGYRIVRVHNVVYYHRGGVFYRPHRHGFVIVRSPWR